MMLRILNLHYSQGSPDNRKKGLNIRIQSHWSKDRILEKVSSILTVKETFATEDLKFSVEDRFLFFDPSGLAMLQIFLVC